MSELNTTNERDQYKFPMRLRLAMEHAATVLKNSADYRRRELDEDSQALVRSVLDELDSACTEANLAARRAAPVGEVELPALPEPLRFAQWTGGEVFAYTAEQVRQAQQAAIASYVERIRVLERELAGQKPAQSIESFEFGALLDKRTIMRAIKGEQWAHVNPDGPSPQPGKEEA
jgi:hypothetical protein